MYKILVVDDEPIVSSGIKAYLLQSGLAIDQVETAFNGFEALDYIRMEPFDLVIADIQMPGMNGLELMEAAFMERPGLPFIVISAHEKFDFVQKSLRLGARDYLVKPIELTDLQQIVSRTLDERKTKSDRTFEASVRRYDEEPKVFEQNVLYELTTDPNLSDQDRGQMLRQIGDPFSGRTFCVMIAALDLSKGGFSEQSVTPGDRTLLRYSAHNIMEESLAQWQGKVLHGIGNQIIAVLQWPAGEDAEQEQPIPPPELSQWIARLIHTNLKTYINIEAAIGLSTIREGIASLPQLYVEAGEALRGYIRHPGHAVFSYGDQMTQSRDTYQRWLKLVEQLLDELRSALSDHELDRHLARISRCLDEMDGSDEMRNSCIGMLVYRLYGVLLEYSRDMGRTADAYDPAVYFQGEQGFFNKAGLLAYIGEAGRLIRDYFTQMDESAIHATVDYMKRHYGNTELKLQEIAGAVHMSPNYLSYLFKKMIGKNLWDYLTEIRLEEAKRLLKDTELRRYEIAYRIGYESPEHFSRVFKKMIGISPADFRKQSDGRNSG